MTSDELERRVVAFVLRVMRLVDALPRTVVGRRLGGQLFDAASSVGANYRAARRARSKREFVAKVCIVVEEADESAYWLTLVIAGGLLPGKLVSPLKREAEELTRIFSAMRATARRRTRARSASANPTSPHRHIATSPHGPGTQPA